MTKKIYPKGIYFNAKRDNAPDFVLGSISIDLSKLNLEELQNYKNGKWYVNLDVLQWDERPYLAVNTYWLDNTPEDTRWNESTGISVDSIPF